jgi:hypothetical protein
MMELSMLAKMVERPAVEMISPFSSLSSPVAAANSSRTWPS